MTATTVIDGDTTAKSSSHVTTIIAAAIGTVSEWYDFTLYAASAGILAKKFFSGLDPSLSFIFALLTFGVGFVVRPLGAIVFGRLGDQIGRKRTFLITIVIMGIVTFSVGLLPTYAAIGVLAPALLLTLRVIQGLALGGEYGGAVIFITEHVQRNRRGLSTSFIQMTGTLGFLMALISIQLVQAAFGQDAFDDWAWRVPFLVSIVLFVVSIRVRLRMHESPIFKKMAEERRLSAAPVRETFGSLENLKLLAIALVGIGGAMSVVYYNAVTYPLFFLTKTLGVPANSANFIVGLAALFAIPMIWFAGWLSDLLGRKPVMLAGFALGLVATFPVFHQVAEIANPELMEVQRKINVEVLTDGSSCSFMFNPLGNKAYNTACDVARQILADSSVNYTRVDQPALSPTEVRLGARVVAGESGVDFDRSRFAKELAEAVKSSGFSLAANPDIKAQMKIVGLLLILLLAMALGYAPVGVAMAEMFPARIRYTAMSFPYHFSSGWIGGLLPTFAFAIAVAQGNIFAGLWYTVGWLIVGSVITGLFYHERENDSE